jgi:hypothetical protein
MKPSWAIGAALLIAGPIMALPSGRPSAQEPETQAVVVDLTGSQAEAATTGAKADDKPDKVDILLHKISARL